MLFAITLWSVGWPSELAISVVNEHEIEVCSAPLWMRGVTADPRATVTAIFSACCLSSLLRLEWQVVRWLGSLLSGPELQPINGHNLHLRLGSGKM